MSTDRKAHALPDISLTPSQTRALKLAKTGDLHGDGNNGWTLKDAVVTYARTDRFRERPRKVVVVNGKTIGELREHGFLQGPEVPAEAGGVPYQITMQGKIWLLQNK